MDWTKEFKIDLLQTEMDRIATTNKKYLQLEEDRQGLLDELKKSLTKAEMETVEKLIDVMDLQNYLMIRSVLRIGIL